MDSIRGSSCSTSRRRSSSSCATALRSGSEQIRREAIREDPRAARAVVRQPGALYGCFSRCDRGDGARRSWAVFLFGWIWLAIVLLIAITVLMYLRRRVITGSSVKPSGRGHQTPRTPRTQRPSRTGSWPRSSTRGAWTHRLRRVRRAADPPLADGRQAVLRERRRRAYSPETSRSFGGRASAGRRRRPAAAGGAGPARRVGRRNASVASTPIGRENR